MTHLLKMWPRCHPFPPQQNPFAFSDMHKKVNLPQRVRPACLSAVGPSDRLLVIPASCMIPSLIFASNHGRVRAESACLPAVGALRRKISENLLCLSSRLMLLLQLSLSLSLSLPLSPLSRSLCDATTNVVDINYLRSTIMPRTRNLRAQRTNN